MCTVAIRFQVSLVRLKERFEIATFALPTVRSAMLLLSNSPPKTAASALTLRLSQ
jgi:hypothetical protein